MNESGITRRHWLGAGVAGLILGGCDHPPGPATGAPDGADAPGAPGAPARVLGSQPLRRGVPWETIDPFLFCAHHDDRYPAGNAAMGPNASLDGRRIGSDFGARDGWSMYHGDAVPGFPQHPHRGFETVSLVRRGLVDHADSLGATARYGEGDVQWMTAGRGIVHAEMFPLLRRDAGNPLEMFQVWLNLPARDKMVDPHFTMLWRDAIPRQALLDAAGRKTVVTIVAGALGAAGAAAPPPQSWAARADNDVAIWTLDMDGGASFALPAARPGSRRMLYFFRGSRLEVAGRAFDAHSAIELSAAHAIPLSAGDGGAELLLLQGRPIEEPVARHGPFVMNTRAELELAYRDYRATGFGGWPWPGRDPVHPRDRGRFARHVDGRVEKAT